MHRRLGVLVVLVGLSLTGSAFALRRVQWSTRTSRDSGASGVTSGASATEVIAMRAGYESLDKQFDGSPGLAFGGLTIGESGDKPCSVSFDVNKLDEGSKDGKATSLPCAKGNVGDYKSAKLADDAFIRGVQVCTNDDANNPRLKGVRFWGVKFDDQGKWTNLSTAVSFERANCKKWHEARYCYNGEVASALKVYKKDDSVTAIGLVCRPGHTAETAPKDFSLSVESAVIGDGSTPGSRLDTKIRLKNNLSKPLRYFQVQFRPDAAKYGTTCGMSANGTVDLAANGTKDHDLSVSCNWEEFYKQIPGCDPGKICNFEFIYYIQWLGESYSDYYRPSGGTVTVPIRRPGVQFTPAKAPVALPPAGLPGKPFPK